MRNTLAPFLIRPFIQTLVMSVVFLDLALLYAEPAPLVQTRPTEKKHRRYQDGPLTSAEFTMPVPNPLPNDAGIPMVAMTYTELRYNYRYQWKEKDGKFTAWPSEVEMFSTFSPERSWNSLPESPRVLEHEQGHFDLTEIYARRGAEKFARGIVARQYQGSGKTEAEARGDLEAKLKKELDKMIEELTIAQRGYDRATRHGLDSQAQIAARKEQREELEKLKK